MKNVKKLVLLLALCFCLPAQIMAQVSTIDIVGMHQLIDESQSENGQQTQARDQQAASTANEQANQTMLGQFKNIYGTLQQRFNSLGIVINLADIGIQAVPMVNKIVAYQSQIVQLAQQNPAIIPLSYQVEIEFSEEATALLGYVIGITITYDDINQMKPSDRKLLFDYVISELSKIQELSGNLVRLLQYSNLTSIMKSLNPFQNFVSQDKALGNSIIQNAKYLKR